MKAYALGNVRSPYQCAINLGEGGDCEMMQWQWRGIDSGMCNAPKMNNVSQFC